MIYIYTSFIRSFARSPLRHLCGVGLDIPMCVLSSAWSDQTAKQQYYSAECILSSSSYSYTNTYTITYIDNTNAYIDNKLSMPNTAQRRTGTHTNKTATQLSET